MMKVLTQEVNKLAQMDTIAALVRAEVLAPS